MNKLTVVEKTEKVTVITYPELDGGALWDLVKSLPILFKTGIYLPTKYIPPENLESISIE